MSEATVINMGEWARSEVVERLRDLTLRAERGELAAVGVIVQFHDGSTGEAWGRDLQHGSVQGLVYGCEMLKTRLIQMGLP